jgi:hypothetical protein
VGEHGSSRVGNRHGTETIGELSGRNRFQSATYFVGIRTCNCSSAIRDALNVGIAIDFATAPERERIDHNFLSGEIGPNHHVA